MILQHSAPKTSEGHFENGLDSLNHRPGKALDPSIFSTPESGVAYGSSADSAKLMASEKTVGMLLSDPPNILEHTPSIQRIVMNAHLEHGLFSLTHGYNSRESIVLLVDQLTAGLCLSQSDCFHPAVQQAAEILAEM